MRPKGRHVAVMTKNREKMVEFYQKIFGLEPKRGFGGAIYMSDGDVNIALIDAKRDDQKEGINHFGFEVDDLDDIKRRLQEAGFNAEIDSKSDKDSDHRIQDPDGHWVDMAGHRRWPKELVKRGIFHEKGSRKAISGMVYRRGMADFGPRAGRRGSENR